MHVYVCSTAYINKKENVDMVIFTRTHNDVVSSLGSTGGLTILLQQIARKAFVLSRSNRRRRVYLCICTACAFFCRETFLFVLFANFSYGAFFDCLMGPRLFSYTHTHTHTPPPPLKYLCGMYIPLSISSHCE